MILRLAPLKSLQKWDFFRSLHWAVRDSTDWTLPAVKIKARGGWCSSMAGHLQSQPTHLVAATSINPEHSRVWFALKCIHYKLCRRTMWLSVSKKWSAPYQRRRASGNFRGIKNSPMKVLSSGISVRHLTLQCKSSWKQIMQSALKTSLFSLTSTTGLHPQQYPHQMCFSEHCGWGLPGAEPLLVGWVRNKWKIKSCWILYLYLIDGSSGQMGVLSYLTGYSNRKEMWWFWSRKHPNRRGMRGADLHLRPRRGNILSHRLGAASGKVSAAKTGNVPSLNSEVEDGLSCSHEEIRRRAKIYFWYPLKIALSGGRIFMKFILANAKRAPNLKGFNTSGHGQISFPGYDHTRWSGY